ncbi:transmembrane protein 32, partial [Colletotrichum tofieldiae]
LSRSACHLHKPPRRPQAECSTSCDRLRSSLRTGLGAVFSDPSTKIYIMTWISRSITAIGLLLLGHACYSAQEHSALQSFRAASPLATSSPSATTSLPADITIETAIATVVIILGLVLGAPNLRPIQWRVWAGKIEREGEAGFLTGSGEVEKDYVGNPFRILESRPGFADIRKQRRDFTNWVKSGDKTGNAAASH